MEAQSAQPGRRPRRLIGLVTSILSMGVLLWACGPDGGKNHRPQLNLDVGAQESYVVGEDIIQIRATATDPDGDKLRFNVAGQPDRASFQVYDNEALFQWDPITSDVTMGDPRRLTFIVTDGNGGRTEKVVEVSIQPGNGVPKFETPSSTLYDTSSEEPIEVDIVVRDDDSESVDITMPAEEAPERATFEKSDPKSGTFTWDPSKSQRKGKVHTVEFVADDGNSDPVRHKLTIIFKGQQDNKDRDPPDQMQDCGQEKAVEFEPLGPKRTLEDYAIEAKLNKSIADRYDFASVLYTTGDPLNDPDQKFQSAKLEIEGRTLSGAIPRIEIPKGQSRTVFYAVCALDSDADPQEEGSLVCSPARGFHSFIAYAPDVETCLDDGQQIGEAGSAASLSTSRWKKFRLCQGAKDLHKLTVEPGETLEVYLSYPFGQSVDFRLLDTQLKPVETPGVEKSPCAGLAATTVKVPENGARTTYFLEATGDNIPYQTYAIRKGGSGGQCTPDAKEPNDSSDEATLIVEDKTLSTMSVCPAKDIDVFILELLEGDEFKADLSFTHADGNVDAALFAPSNKLDGNSPPEAKAVSMTDDETLTHTAGESGLYHFVAFAGDEATNDYTVDFSFTCRDKDEFPDNHTRDDAAVAAVKTYEDLKLCGGTSDWYQRTGFQGANLKATLQIDSGARLKDVTFRAVDESGTEVATATRKSGRAVIDFAPSSGGQYYFEVTTDKNVLYSLTFEQQ